MQLKLEIYKAAASKGKVSKVSEVCLPHPPRCEGIRNGRDYGKVGGTLPILERS